MLASARVAFAQAGPELVQAVVDALRTHPQPPYNRPAHTSGRTAQAIRFDATDDGLTVYGPAHAQTLITGRGPTGAGGSAGAEPLRVILAQWAEDKGIQLSPGMSYQSFGFLAARKIHQAGTALYRLGQPSRLFADVLTPDRLQQLKARIAAGEMVALASELRNALTP